jgi:hypothetical protein
MTIDEIKTTIEELHSLVIKCREDAALLEQELDKLYPEVDIIWDGYDGMIGEAHGDMLYTLRNIRKYKENL